MTLGSFKFKKQYGQNFLKDEALLAQIVEKSGVMSDDVVVEVGAGRGALTLPLSEKVKRIYSFEIDEELVSYLQENVKRENVKFIFEDVLAWSEGRLNKLVDERFKLVANLPYYITSPIITKFVKNPNLDSLTVMVQEEVADRIVASPKTKDYGVLTIICALFGKAEKVMRVSRENFYPVPNVDSAVVRIDRNVPFEISDYDGFISFIKRAFSMRRKKLSSNLQSEKLKKQDVEAVLSKLGFSEDVRAEELSPQDFRTLYELFSDKM